MLGSSHYIFAIYIHQRCNLKRFILFALRVTAPPAIASGRVRPKRLAWRTDPAYSHGLQRFAWFLKLFSKIGMSLTQNWYLPSILPMDIRSQLHQAILVAFEHPKTVPQFFTNPSLLRLKTVLKTVHSLVGQHHAKDEDKDHAKCVVDGQGPGPLTALPIQELTAGGQL